MPTKNANNKDNNWFETLINNRVTFDLNCP